MVFVCWCVSMCVCVSVSGYVLIQVLMCVCVGGFSGQVLEGQG